MAAKSYPPITPEEAADDEAKNVVLCKDANLLLQSCCVSLLVEGGNLAEKLIDGIEDGAQENHLVRAGTPGIPVSS